MNGFSSKIISVSLAVIMAGPIKLFETVQKINKAMGISHEAQTSPAKLTKNLFVIASTTQLFISSTAFFLFEAQTADDYGISFYVSLTTLCVVINFVTVVWKKDRILTLIECYEIFIGKS